MSKINLKYQKITSKSKNPILLAQDFNNLDLPPSNLGKRDPNKCTIRPSIIKIAAISFHTGKPSPKKKLEANIPNTGTNKVNGTTVPTE